EATATGHYAEATAVALDALRQRAVRDFQARVEMARLRRQHADALETTARLQQALDSAAEEEARLVHAATHDALTGCPNRALLHERLNSAIRRARATGRHLAVAFVDVNGLKTVNDQQGHAAGDLLVCGVAYSLRAVNGPHDTVARVGGDEFVIVVVARADEQGCLAWVEELREVLQPWDGSADHVPASRASAGVCVVAPACALPGEAILARADELMYQAKAAGGAHPAVELLV
ncbi:MAG: hypothetical protein QG597_311, partial [Actinomycetota bacterium]|nr:hypothetical protein [Actinomycetota bacterium]